MATAVDHDAPIQPLLESLREPLETDETVVTLANCHVTYAAQCQLVAAMNP